MDHLHIFFLSTDPPTRPTLNMETEVTEVQLITIICTVESYPLSTLTLKRSSKLSRDSLILRSSYSIPPNELRHTFNATSAEAGIYSCDARNTEGWNTSTKKELVVKCE